MQKETQRESPKHKNCDRLHGVIKHDVMIFYLIKLHNHLHYLDI